MATPDTLRKLYRQKLSFISGSLNSFDADLKRLQTELFDLLITEYASRLEVVDGKIVMSVKNGNLIAELDKYLNEFKNAQSLETFSRLGKNMLKMTGLTSDYYRAMVGGSKTIDRLTKQLEGYRSLIGIDKKGKVISGSYIDHLATNQQMKTVLSGYVQRSIEGQVDLKTFTTGFKDLIKGSDEINGVYERYAGSYANDAFFAQSRQQDNFFAQELGLEYFVYEGEVIESSRKFCVERHGKIFSQEQGMSWNLINWVGKIPNVPFFEQCGGYNCRHTIRWITNDMAEEEGISIIEDTE